MGPTNPQPRRRRPDPREVLDETRRHRILALLAGGSSRRVAADFVGCSPSTITRTADRDPEFADQLAWAECNVEIEALRNIRKASAKPRHWRAAAWLLERINREDFAAYPPEMLPLERASDFVGKILDTMDDDFREQFFERLDLMCDDPETWDRKYGRRDATLSPLPRTLPPDQCPPPSHNDLDEENLDEEDDESLEYSPYRRDRQHSSSGEVQHPL